MKKEINKTIKVGEINTLEIARDTDFGFYLVAEDKSEVLLPNAYIVEEEMPLGSAIDVFVYTDSEDRLVAVTKEPYAKLNELGYFTVVDSSKHGAFVNWGLPKDLFVPKSAQKEPLKVGKKYILRVCLDDKTNRVYATQKIGKYFSKDTKKLKPKARLKAIVVAKTPLGFKVVADNKYEGMLFKNEIFKELKIGQKIDVYIKSIRDDGKLDLSLNAIGKEQKRDEAQEAILKELKKSKTLPFTSKSNPEDIKKRFGLSKKSFKAALNSLIESKRVEIVDSEIRLAK